MQMVGRKWNGGNYRYGFNGKENDDDVKGESNTIAFENRIYDPRLGKWFSVDPLQKKYAGFSPYNFVENNPIVYVDKDGRDKWLNILITDERTGKTTQLSILISHEVKAGQRGLVPSFGNLNYYDWDDINLNYNITVDKDGKVNTTFTEERGKTQTTTMGKNALKAKMNIWYNNLSQKDADIGEGFLLTGEDGGLGDPLGPGAKKVDIIDNADGLLAMLGNWREFGGKIEPAELIKELGGWEKVKKFLESADNTSDAISAIEDALGVNRESETTEKFKPNSTICGACGEEPHGLPVDYITDEKGNVKDTIKNTQKYNPKSKQNETKKDTIPTKKKG